MQDIDNNKIMELEQVIKEMFTTFIADSAFKSSVLQSVDAVHVFGFFESNISRFAFLPGHRTDLAKVGDEVKQHSTDYYKTPSDYKVPRKNIVRSPIGYLFGTKTRAQSTLSSNFSAAKNCGQFNSMQIGSVSSDETQFNSTTSDLPSLDITTSGLSTFNGDEPSSNLQFIAAKSKLLLLINPLLQPFQVSITDDDINITNDGTKLTARVVCKLCTTEEKVKRICVQYEQSNINSCCYWSTSNFRKHLKSHSAPVKSTNKLRDQQRIKRKQTQPLQTLSKRSKTDMTNSEDGACVEKCVESNEAPIVLTEPIMKQNRCFGATVKSHRTTQATMTIQLNKKDGANANDSVSDSEVNLRDLFTTVIIDQLNAQNERMSKLMVDSKLADEMVFKLNNKTRRTVNVIRIDRDGDCLFASLAFHIHQNKIGTNRHSAAVKQIRQEAVSHIKKNYKSFKYQMHGRLFEECDGNGFVLGKDLDADALKFLDHTLLKSGTWGGAETIKAISELYQVNILVIEEENKCCFPFAFNMDYTYTVAIAFRLGENTQHSTKHNHYDAIWNISEHCLFNCAVDLAKAEVSRRKLKEDEQMVIDLASL